MRDKANQMFTLSALWQMAKPGWLISFCLGLITLASGLTLLGYSGWFISAAAIAGVIGTQAGLFNYLRPGAMIRLLAILRTAGRYAEKLQSHYTILEVLKTLRLETFKLLCLRFNPYYSLRARRFEALQQLIADIDLLDQYPLRIVLPYFWAFTLSAIAAILLIIWLPEGALVIIAVWFSLLVVLPATQYHFCKQLAAEEAVVQSQRREFVLENMTGLTTLSMMGQSQQFLRQFANTEHELLPRQAQLILLNHIFSALQQLILLVLTAYLLMLHPSLQPALLIGALLALLGANEILSPLNQLHQMWAQVYQAQQRLKKLVSQPTIQATGVHLVLDNKVALSLKQLRWQHSSNTTIDCTLSGGDLVLLSGSSGAGKSSLFATIVSDLPLISGEILVQGPAAKISILEQHPYVFSLSIAANLRIAMPNASDQQLLDVLEIVELMPWLARQSNGLLSQLGQEHGGFSGGEARRFALARCLLADADLLLLDEPFAGLPIDQAERILLRLKVRLKDKICLIISHQVPDMTIFNRFIHI